MTSLVGSGVEELLFRLAHLFVERCNSVRDGDLVLLFVPGFGWCDGMFHFLELGLL